MKLSHSKLNCILGCPMTYYLCYHQGIWKKDGKPALAIGSAVHWGIEHNTEDLTQYWLDTAGFRGRDTYGRDQILAEAMVHGYMKNKDKIFDEILDDGHGGKLKLLEEQHEVFLTGKLKSKLSDVEYHKFVGIIDLLLVVEDSNGNVGCIIIDYKTSTFIPHWEDYLDQIYRYNFLVETGFEDMPLFKAGIVNIRKTGIKLKKGENQESFIKRMVQEYDINDDQLVSSHMYLPEQLDKNFMHRYIDNLSNMADVAHTIDANHSWYINYANAVNQYGKSDYWDIFYHTENAEVLYTIEDKIYDDTTNTFIERRDCKAIDMKVIDYDNVLNKYKIFLEEFFKTPELEKDEFIKRLKDKYITDDELLEQYWMTMLEDLSRKEE